MKSGRQRRIEISAKRGVRRKVAAQQSFSPRTDPPKMPVGAVPADQDALLHDNTWGPRPRHYIDRPFQCIDCGASEVWTASQQKWWYEVAKGKLASAANRCATCRRRIRLRRAQERRIHIEGLIEKYGFDSTAERLKLTTDALQEMRARWLEEKRPSRRSKMRSRIIF